MPEPGASGALVAWPPDVLGLALEHSPVGLAPVGPGGSMHLVNAALCAYLERDEPTLLSSTWRDVTLAEDLDIDGPLVDEMWAGTRGTYRVLKRYVRPSGAVVWGDLAVSSVRDPDGSVVCLICQIVDATEREVAKDILKHGLYAVPVALLVGLVGWGTAGLASVAFAAGQKERQADGHRIARSRLFQHLERGQPGHRALGHLLARTGDDAHFLLW